MSDSNQKPLFTFHMGPSRLIAAGVVLTVLVFAARSGAAQQLWEILTGNNLPVSGAVVPGTHSQYSEHNREGIGKESPQQQAEELLEAAVNHDEGATDVIEKLAPTWYGKIHPTEAWENFSQLAMNSNDLRVRAAAIETNLAMLNLPRERETVTGLIQQAEHDARLRARNAVWLGMLANRGIEPQRVREWLITWHQEADERSRISIARALALAASDDALNDLLNTVKGDRSDQVRAIAARSIARTGMFSETQRWHAVPQLIDISFDPALSDSTKDSIFGALEDITAQSDYGENSSAWLTWYRSYEQNPGASNEPR